VSGRVDESAGRSVKGASTARSVERAVPLLVVVVVVIVRECGEGHTGCDRITQGGGGRQGAGRGWPRRARRHNTRTQARSERCGAPAARRADALPEAETGGQRSA
jgi:hypothetical protein